MSMEASSVMPMLRYSAASSLVRQRTTGRGSVDDSSIVGPWGEDGDDGERLVPK